MLPFEVLVLFLNFWIAFLSRFSVPFLTKGHHTPVHCWWSHSNWVMIERSSYIDTEGSSFSRTYSISGDTLMTVKPADFSLLCIAELAQKDSGFSTGVIVNWLPWIKFHSTLSFSVFKAYVPSRWLFRTQYSLNHFTSNFSGASFLTKTHFSTGIDVYVINLSWISFACIAFSNSNSFTVIQTVFSFSIWSVWSSESLISNERSELSSLNNLGWISYNR